MAVTVRPGNLNREALRELRREVLRFIAAPQRGRGLAMLGGLVVGLLVINGLNVLNSYVGRDFITAIENRDAIAWRHETWFYLGVLGLSTLVVAANRFMEERLGLLWRKWLTRTLMSGYFSRLVYVRIEGHGQLLNPDQRITDDVRSFTASTLSFVVLVLNALITIFSFSGVLWSISPRLLVGAVLYALTGSLLTFLVGRRLVGLNVSQLDCEAELRSELTHARQNAESLAISRREGHLFRRSLRRLDELVRNNRKIIAVNLRVGLLTNGYNYLLQLIPALIVAPLFLRGEIEFGVVTQSAMAFAFLSGAFSLVVTQFQSISSYGAVVARLGRLVDLIERDTADGNAGFRVEEQGRRFCLQKLSLHRADGVPLVKDLDLEVTPGMRLLVTSFSGHAKVALFRAIGEVNGHYATGCIIRPEPRNLVLVPERPYLPRSSLRELLASSDTDGLPDDAELTRVLAMLQLESVVGEAGGLDTEQDWSSLLGASEQIRLLVARILVMRPLYVLLDRIWSVLDPAQLERVFHLLEGQETAFAMLGRPDHPVDHFNTILDIGREGRWSLRPIVRAKEPVKEAGW